jgi:hypothetical protein
MPCPRHNGRHSPPSAQPLTTRRLPLAAAAQPLLTPLWQAAVAAMGFIMMVLMMRKAAKAKAEPDVMSKAV